MFGELLESRAKRRRNRAGTIASVAGHAVIMALAVVATRTPLIARGPVEHLVPLPAMAPPSPRPSAPAPAPRRAPSPSAPVAPAPPVAPIILDPHIVPVGIPPIDMTRSPTEFAWPSDGPASSSTPGTRAHGTGLDDGIAFAANVEKPAMALPGSPPPRYPDVLRRASVKGEVVIHVVIDTTGRADMTTVRVISSDHPLFTEAVLAALPRARFLPAETGGRKVPMWAVQSFVFEVR